jgi:hypothetical protein|tara:strand:- start:368 stop:571 length:204 start_codon:yes stop_codon:yes gene_type:complete
MEATPTTATKGGAMSTTHTTTRTPATEVLRAIRPHFEELWFEYDRMSQDGKDAMDAIGDIFEGKAGQ